MTYFFSLWLQ